jgi:hypothetical protein
VDTPEPGSANRGIPRDDGCGTISCIAREEDPKREIAALERELQRIRHEAEKNRAALDALDEQRREREDRLSLALRAQQEFERLLEEKRVELSRAEAEAAREAFEQALTDRDAAAQAFASAAQSIMLRLKEFDAAQENAESMWHAQLQSAAGAELRDPHALPGVFTEALATLVELLSQRTDRQLERDLVEAAARSPLGNDIPNLPAHLQELARARYVAIAREKRERNARRAGARTSFENEHDASETESPSSADETASETIDGVNRRSTAAIAGEEQAETEQNAPAADD